MRPLFCAMKYAVVGRGLGKLAAKGDGLIFTYGYDAGRKAPVPEATVVAIRELENNSSLT